MFRSLPNHRAWRLLPRIGCAAVLVGAFILATAGNSQVQTEYPAGNDAGNASAAPAAEAHVESYPLTEKSRGLLVRWQEQAAKRNDLRVAIDERSGQALVYATPSTHAELRRQLAQLESPFTPATPSPAQAESSATGPSIAAAQANSVLIQLRNAPAGELHTRLEKVLTRTLPATMDAAGEWQSFSIEASPGVAVTMSVNARTSQVRIEGAPPQVAAWKSVIEALDSPPATAGNVTQLVTTKPANQETVRRTLRVLQAQPAINQPANTRTVAMQQPQDAAQPSEAAQPVTPPPPTGGAQPPATQAGPGSLQNALDAARLAEAAGGLLGPVQVEYVEGLDIIVLRGAERDVQRVMEIIQQIEQISQVETPTIEVHPLKYVDSMQLAVLMNRLYTEVLGARLGTVSITPLGTPNAVLLIGRSDNVTFAIDLINRLDQPVIPTAQFQVFPLQNASATEAKTLIDSFLQQDENGAPQQQNAQGPGAAAGAATDANSRPPLAPRALVVADARTNFLIVRASARDLAEIAALLARIDLPGATAQLKVFTITNGDATALQTMLQSLFSVPAAGEAQTGGGLSQGGVVRLQFSVDARTNSIIAAGSAEDLAVVEAILLRLDQGDIRERITTVHRLNNAFADGLAVALQTWLQTQQQAAVDTAVTLSPFEQFEREVIIVPEAATNSLIVSATPRIYKEVVDVIHKLDERPPMVMIQVLIAEVRLNDTDEFGIELGLQDSLLFDRSLLGTLSTLTTTTQTQGAGGAVTNVTQQQVVNAPGQPGFNFNNQALGNNLSTSALATASNVAAQGLSNFALNRTNGELGFGGFVFSASSNSVSVLLRALQENRRLEVLSRPQLMALDGQLGQVQVGQNVPRIVATSFDALTGQVNQIQYEPVGLILQVVPRISPDGLVVLQIIANKSEVGPEAEGIPISVSPTGTVLRAPRIEITQAQTTVSALSGQTVVLGGLLQTRKLDVHRRVPLLADIPLLGDLFRYDAVAEERRELLIILTPRIVYGKEDSDLVKQIESSRMSWILGDVINVHGDAGLRSRCDEWHDADIEAVYPNMMPEEGLLPLSDAKMLPMEGPAMMAPYCDPSGVPGTPVPTTQMPGDTGAGVPTPPLPPQDNLPSTMGVVPQSGTEATPSPFGNTEQQAAPESATSASPMLLPVVND